MIRACLAGFVCWVALGALGPPSVVAPSATAADTRGAGFVSAPAAPDDPRVVEGKPLSWSAVAERNAPGAERHAGRSVTLVGGRVHVPRQLAHTSCAQDTRHASRMSTTARRTIDLRREVFRIAPGRRAGRVEAASTRAALT